MIIAIVVLSIVCLFFGVLNLLCYVALHTLLQKMTEVMNLMVKVQTETNGYARKGMTDISASNAYICSLIDILKRLNNQNQLSQLERLPANTTNH